MEKNLTNIISGLLALFLLLIGFLFSFAKVFSGTSLQYWVITVGFTLAILFLMLDIFNGYRATISTDGVILYKLLIKHYFKWTEIDKNIAFENHSFKFKVNNKRYHVPIIYYKKPEEIITLIKSNLKVN